MSNENKPMLGSVTFAAQTREERHAPYRIPSGYTLAELKRMQPTEARGAIDNRAREMLIEDLAAALAALVTKHVRGEMTGAPEETDDARRLLVIAGCVFDAESETWRLP